MKAETIRQDDIYSQEAEAGVLGSLIRVSQGDRAKVGEVIGQIAYRLARLKQWFTQKMAMT